MPKNSEVMRLAASELNHSTPATKIAVQTPTIRGRVAHMLNAYELSLHGVGIAIYPATISSLIRDKDVCVRKIDHPDAYASYALIWNKNHTLSHVAEAFINHIEEELKMEG